MDAVKLKNSCICGNTRPYTECCGLYAQAPDANGAAGPGRKWAEFRHALHELYMYLFPLRNLYQAYWEKLSQENYPHHLLMSDPEYGRVVVANFFWDYSVQFSDARPILRAARDVEDRDLRMANDFRQWSLSPLWLAVVVEADAERAHLRMLGSEKVHRVVHGGELPEPGTCVAVRLLSYRGEEHVHPAVLVMPRDDFSGPIVEEKFLRMCESLRVKSGAGLRPDVQCEEWRRHGSLFLELWRELAYDLVVGVPARKVGGSPVFKIPVADVAVARRKLAASEVIPSGKNRFELRYRTLLLARFELRGGAIHGTLMDEAFRSFAEEWFEEHLGESALRDDDGATKTVPTLSPVDLERWIQKPLFALNAESPLQASLHDFGRRRLQGLLVELSEQGHDLVALRRRLGL